MINDDSLDRFGIELAVDYVQALGMAILARGVVEAAAELDIIARDGDTLVAIDVHTRRTPVTEPGEPSMRRSAAMSAALLAWATDGGVLVDRARVDAISIAASGTDDFQLSHQRGAAFDARRLHRAVTGQAATATPMHIESPSSARVMEL